MSADISDLVSVLRRLNLLAQLQGVSARVSGMEDLVGMK